MDYKVKIEDYEGPMDLLLLFIKRDKLNIYDINIYYITNEFLNHLNELKKLNINVGGEFIFMASYLMRIKSRMLLPLVDEEDMEYEDPRADLIETLLIYKQYKDASMSLDKKYFDHSAHYSSGFTINNSIQSSNLPLNSVSLYKLNSTFKELIGRLPYIDPYEVNEDPISLNEQIVFLEEKLNSKKEFYLSKLFPIIKTKIKLVVTFMAVLELLRRGHIHVEQNSAFEEILIKRL